MTPGRPTLAPDTPCAVCPEPRMLIGRKQPRTRTYCRRHQAAWQRGLRTAHTLGTPPPGVSRIVFDGRASIQWRTNGKPTVTPLAHPELTPMLVRYFLAAGYRLTAREKQRVTLEKEARGTT